MLGRLGLVECLGGEQRVGDIEVRPAAAPRIVDPDEVHDTRAPIRQHAEEPVEAV